MDPFSLDHIFPLSRLAPYSFHGTPWSCVVSRDIFAPAAATLRPATPYTVIRVIFRDIRAPRSLTLRLSGANGQTPRFFFSATVSSGIFSLPSSCQRALNCSVRSFGSPLSSGARPTLEVWGLEPQTYGLQSHRSSH